MDVLRAAFLGLIQGITEFLPVSSSALTELFGRLTGYSSVPSLRLSAALHTGTFFAMLLLLRRSILRTAKAFFEVLRALGKNFVIFVRNLRRVENRGYVRVLTGEERALSALIAAAFVPALLLGIVLRSFVRENAGSELALSMGFFLTAILLLTAGRMPAHEEDGREVRPVRALLIGIAQGLGVLPGVSRFGATLAAGKLTGLRRTAALRTALLISLPVTAGGIISELFSKSGEALTAKMHAGMILGALISFAVSFFLAGRIIRFMKKGYYTLFGAVNALLCVVMIVLYLAG